MPEAGMHPDMSAYYGDVMTMAVRNFEAMTKVQQAMLDGLQPLFERQMTFVQSNLEENLKTMQGLFAEPDAKLRMVKQIEATKAAIQSHTGQSNTLGEMAAKSGARASDIVQGRMLEALDEVRTSLEKNWAA